MKICPSSRLICTIPSLEACSSNVASFCRASETVHTFILPVRRISFTLNERYLDHRAETPTAQRMLIPSQCARRTLVLYAHLRRMSQYAPRYPLWIASTSRWLAL